MVHATLRTSTASVSLLLLLLLLLLLKRQNALSVQFVTETRRGS